MARQSFSDPRWPVRGGLSIFDALLDGMADELARRVIGRIDQYLESRSLAAPPDAYRVDEAAQQLGLSEREVKRRIATGELDSVKIGRARLIPREAIGDFLANRNSTSMG
jgi:excisionase family DNA binding protein